MLTKSKRGLTAANSCNSSKHLQGSPPGGKRPQSPEFQGRRRTHRSKKHGLTSQGGQVPTTGSEAVGRKHFQRAHSSALTLRLRGRKEASGALNSSWGAAGAGLILQMRSQGTPDMLKRFSLLGKNKSSVTDPWGLMYTTPTEAR